MNETDLRHRSAWKRPSVNWLLGVLGLYLLVGVGIHWVTAINDNSIRNAVSLIACGIAALALAIWFFRVLATRIPRGAAALVTLALLLVPVVAFRIRGFTGEIIPQLEFRFSSNRQLPTEIQAVDSQGETVHQAEFDFPEFLGPSRSAVIAHREFAVPSEAQFQPLWRQAIGDGWSGFAIVGASCVTLEQRGEDECVTCYRLADGALLWINHSRVRHENRLGGVGPRSTPTIADGRVYTQGATGIVQCLDLASGEVIWRQELLELAGWSQTQSEKEIAWGRAGSPLLVDQLCILPFGGPNKNGESNAVPADGTPVLKGRTLIALDRADGSVRWTAGADQISFASPMLMNLAGTDQIVSVNEKSVTGHAVDDGRQLWSVDWRGQSNGAANCAAAMQVDDTALLVGKAYGTGSGVFEIASSGDAFTADIRWKHPNVLKTKFTHACVAGGFAYGLSDGMLECVNLSDGKRAWAQPRGARYGHGQVILVEDVLVVQTETGEVAFVAARNDRFEELALLPALQSKTWNIPALAGRYLAIRNDAEAVLYQLPQRSEKPSGDGRSAEEPEMAERGEGKQVAKPSEPLASQTLRSPAALGGGGI